MRTPTTIRAAAAALSLTLVLAGCASGASSVAPVADSTAAVGAPAPAAAGAEKSDGNTREASGGNTDAPDATSYADTTTAERQLARTATMSLTVTDPAKAAVDIRAAAEAAGGWVTRESVISEKRDGVYLKSSLVTVSVPGAKLAGTMDDIARTGTETSRAVEGVDVTGQLVDLDARISAVRDSIARIKELMAKTGTITEIAAVENDLTTRQTELEKMLAQQKNLAGRVAMAPITVTLNPNTVVAEPNPLQQLFLPAWNAMRVSLAAILTLVGGLLPFALIAGLVAWPILAWSRRRKAAGNASRVPTAPAATPPTGTADAAGDSTPPRS